MIRVYTRIEGKLACWDCEDDVTYEDAISAVRDHLGVGHKCVILARIK